MLGCGKVRKRNGTCGRWWRNVTPLLTPVSSSLSATRKLRSADEPCPPNFPFARELRSWLFLDQLTHSPTCRSLQTFGGSRPDLAGQLLIGYSIAFVIRNTATLPRVV